MKKSDRQKIFEKFDGKCAYCGEELQKGWHVDEIEPIRRNWEYIETKNSEYDMRKKYTDCIHPERLTIENQNPSCASCNINKHSQSLEEFREMIAYFIETLNKNSTQYKIAKRYGLIEETGISVKFYFEYKNNTTN